MDPQTPQSPASSSTSAVNWIVLIIILVIVGVGIYLWWQRGGTDVGANVANSQNVNIVNGGEAVAVLPGATSDWMIYKNAQAAFSFPSYLALQANYFDRLVLSSGSEGTVSSITIGTLTEEAVVASGGPERTVDDGVSVEFPGSFQEQSVAHKTTYGAHQFIEKSYVYDPSEDGIASYTMKLTILLLQTGTGEDFLLLRIRGENSARFDQITTQIAQSVTL